MSTPLHVLGDFLRDLLGRVPLPAVRVLFVLIPVLLLVWVLRIPNSETTRTGASVRWDENLKLWAGLALVIQIVIYSVV